MKKNIIFFGTSSFGLPILKKLSLKNNLWEIKAAVTQVDKPVGRHQILTPTPIKRLAQELNLEVLEFLSLKKQSTFNTIKNLEPDLMLIVAYKQILPSSLINLPLLGTYNLHPSLLPKYRGPSPIQTAILEGEKETGVTIIKLDEQIDHGPILIQRKISIEPTDDYLTLEKKLSDLAAWLLIETLPKIIAETVEEIVQKEKKATFTKLITKNDGLIDWGKKAEEILNQIRAYNVWPGPYTYWRGKILKIYRAEKIDLEGKRGKVSIFKNNLIVGTGCQSLIIKELQLEAKKRMLASEFLKGHQKIEGETLG